MAIKKSNASVLKNTCELLINLPEARRVAMDVTVSPSSRGGQFHGVFIPKYAAYTELQLVQLQQELNAIICMTQVV